MVVDGWAPPPAEPDLGGAEAHVWRLDLAAAPDGALLADEELARAGTLRFDVDRRRFTARRWLLRTVLGRYLGVAASEVPLGVGPRGKPRLTVEHGHDLRFSQSTSEAVTMVAVASAREVGIDVERVAAHHADPKLADRFFSPHEVGVLASCDEDRRVDAFFSCWTLKEAFVKALGQGLTAPLDDFDVDAVAGGDEALLVVRSDPAAVDRWSLRSIPAGPGFHAAIAVARPLARIRLWDGPPRDPAEPRPRAPQASGPPPRPPSSPPRIATACRGVGRRAAVRDRSAPAGHGGKRPSGRHRRSPSARRSGGRRRRGRRRGDGREVALRVLPLRERVLRRHLRADARLAGVVDDRHRREVADLPARLLDAVAEVGLLGVDEEALVQDAGALQRLPPGQHERAGRPVARRPPARRPRGRARGHQAHEAAQQRSRPSASPRARSTFGKPADRRPQLAVAGELLHADQPDVGPIVHRSRRGRRRCPRPSRCRG